MEKITAIIPTYNEESNIQRALDSVSFADEIIVIDSFSTDKTVAIVQKSNALLLQRTFDDFSNQKNYAISKASHKWVFVLDADEVASPNLRQEIKKVTNEPNSNVAYFVYRNFYFKNKKLHFSGWRRDKVIRLFQKDNCTYKGKVHEKIAAIGNVGFLNEKLDHYSYTTYTHYKDKLKAYAKLQAQELIVKKQFITPFHLFLKPLIRFIIHFFIQLGVLDGLKGFTISYLQSYGVWLRYIELLKLKSINTTRQKVADFSLLQTDKAKDISIIIVNYKSWTHLGNCLNSINEIDQKSFTYEVIVVDNCSNDGNLDKFISTFDSVRFIKNTGNNGFANACNVGASEAVGEQLLFLNPDTIVSKEPILKMREYLLENEKCGIVSCNQKKPNGTFENTNRLFPSFQTLFGLSRAFFKLIKKKRLIKLFAKNKIVVYPDWVSGSLVFITRGWFEKVQGWNEDYWMYFEDVDISKNVRNLGGTISLLQDVHIIHNHGGSSRINIKTASITKTEVMISKHVYLRNHFKGLYYGILQTLLVVNTIVFKSFLGVVGFFFFFIPKMRLQIYLCFYILKYYFASMTHRAWLSSRAMNHSLRKNTTDE